MKRVGFHLAREGNPCAYMRYISRSWHPEKIGWKSTSASTIRRESAVFGRKHELTHQQARLPTSCCSLRCSKTQSLNDRSTQLWQIYLDPGRERESSCAHTLPPRRGGLLTCNTASAMMFKKLVVGRLTHGKVPSLQITILSNRHTRLWPGAPRSFIRAEALDSTQALHCAFANCTTFPGISEYTFEDDGVRIGCDCHQLMY